MSNIARLPGMTGTRDWVYPQTIDGAFMRLRRVTFLALHVILFAAPWITMKGHPLFLIDLPARHVYLFGAIFTHCLSFASSIMQVVFRLRPCVVQKGSGF